MLNVTHFFYKYLPDGSKKNDKQINNNNPPKNNNNNNNTYSFGIFLNSK